MRLESVLDKMGPKLRWKLFKIVTLCFTLYIFVRLELLLMISSQIFGLNFPMNGDGYYANYPLQKSFLRQWEKKNNFFNKFAKINDEEFIEEDCGIPSLDYKIKSRENTSATSCQRIKPVAGSCRIAHDLFANKKVTDCKHQTNYKLCHVKGKVGSYYASCDTSICKMPVSISNINPDNGEFVWKELLSVTDVENHLNNLLKSEGSKKHFGFCFLKCSFKNSNKMEETDESGFQPNPLQLLVLPPDLNIAPVNQLGRYNLNYNLVFVDSVSRHHLFRSLPNTVQLLNHINEKYVKRGTSFSSHMVLDFEVLQGLKSRTFESLQALFSGYVNPHEKPFGILDMPPKPLNTQMLLENLRRKGYQTLWLEDLCWQWEWGLSKDLHVHDKSATYQETWERLMKAIKTAGIDSLDFTFASCEILDSHNVKDPFHYADDVCFLGKHHHEYTIEYLQYYQNFFNFHRKPYFSFFESNVGHEDTMLRIQQFDKSLSNYLKFAMNLRNTLTIIFSDHGNSYGSFVEKSDEARVEMFHPFLFMIIPPDVQKTLGSRSIDALVQNQKRLISLQDLHEMLYSLSTQNTNITLNKPHTKFKGLNLMEEVPSNRSCTDIPRLMPNLCICQDYENAVKNDSYHAILALYAAGVLNKEIQKQHRANYPNSSSGFGSCRRLIPSEFRNLKTSFGSPKNSAVVKMDLYFRQEMSKQPEVFFVAIRMIRSKERLIELITYERITPYSVYGSCADKGVDLKLCICNHKTRTMIPSKGLTYIMSEEILSVSAEQAYLNSTQKCFYLVTRENDYGFYMEAINECRKGTYHLSLKLWKTNMIISNNNSTIETLLVNGDVTFIVAAVRRNRKLQSLWKYTAELKQIS